MLPFNYSLKKPKQDFLVPESWKDHAKRPRGIEYKNGIYYLFDAGPQKNNIFFAADDVPHLKEIIFYLIQRYTKTYTREYFEQVNGKLFEGINDFLDAKRKTFDGIPGLYAGILFGDKQYKFKQTFYINQNIPFQFAGSTFVVGIAVDRILGPAGNIMRNPQDIGNAYKEIKTVFSQELGYIPPDLAP